MASGIKSPKLDLILIRERNTENALAQERSQSFLANCFKAARIAALPAVVVIVLLLCARGNSAAAITTSDKQPRGYLRIYV